MNPFLRAPGLCCALFAASACLSQTRTPSYAGYTNHMEIVDRAIELADSLGFTESAVPAATVRARLECGVYEEDYAMMPGTVGEHYPSPWTKGPDFPFNNVLPFTKIPYGVLTDAWSGWYRGFSHGYDPLTGYSWPNARGTPLEWANSPDNTFTWNNAVGLYRQGRKEEAYECLGHVLHLLMDLSVPAHVKVVNHGAVFSKQKTGYQWDPDVVSITIDEYEMALNGGLESNLISVIPDLHGIFLNALLTARASGIPRTLDSLSQFFHGLAVLAALNPDVNKYYFPPTAQGTFGHYANGSGSPVNPAQLGSIIGPGQIGDRYTQVALYSTATLSGGTVIPHQTLEALCDSLVPRAAEYSAGVLLLFHQTLTSIRRTTDRQPEAALLMQNYPNPFNPATTIRLVLPQRSAVTLTIHNVLGQEVATLLRGELDPGTHDVKFDGSALPGGIYFYRLRAGDFDGTKRLLLLR